jgi:hypothetical protein
MKITGKPTHFGLKKNLHALILEDQEFSHDHIRTAKKR